MTRHLEACDRPVAGGKHFHLVVQARYSTAYWIHLAAPVDAPLSKVDDFLRHIWLECCGHLSAFEIAGRRYSVAPMAELDEKGMRPALSRVLDVGTKFSYEYDFGTTTALELKAVAVREGGTPGGKIQLLARNDKPEVPCDRCGKKTATQICTECDASENGWLCDDCAATHECDPEMFLPVVNSPRVGVCGYTG